MFMSKKSRAKIDLNFLRPSPCTDKKWKSPIFSCSLFCKMVIISLNIIVVIIMVIFQNGTLDFLKWYRNFLKW